MAAEPRLRAIDIKEASAFRSPGVQAVPLAAAATVVALVGYLICRIVSVIAPGFLVWFLEPWFHGVMLQPLIPSISTFQPTEFVIGLLTFSVTVWLTVFVFARLYNRWSR